VLYAGLEQGVWFSLDRGSHWQSLRLNMPPVAVHDMRIQPQRDDLMLATHGRGFWILDDVGAIAGLSKAVGSAAPTLFPLQTAYTWYRWWTSYYGTHPDECCLAAGMYSGEDPSEGSAITYYLPSRTHVRFEIFDETGTQVRCLEAPGDAGVMRTAWNLTETPPVPWFHTREWNRGGPGATVIPGRYTVRMHAGSSLAETPLEVRPDPRAAWTIDKYIMRHRFVTKLNEELSAIDIALNRLDSLATGSSFDKLRMTRDKLSLTRLFTSGVVNSEDDLLKPDGLRERLTILQGTLALSQGPPTPAQEGAANSIHAQFEIAMNAYQSFLQAHHLPPDSSQEGCR
ncbi:MAG TPA: hypothetical protein VEW74_06580, partial [Candidatus Nitrosotalea sp.]|nr:hypothetical protein [Candidatus Nitrosotalea sp.]